MLVVRTKVLFPSETFFSSSKRATRFHVPLSVSVHFFDRDCVVLELICTQSIRQIKRAVYLAVLLNSKIGLRNSQGSPSSPMDEGCIYGYETIQCTNQTLVQRRFHESVHFVRKFALVNDHVKIFLVHRMNTCSQYEGFLCS